MARLTQKIKEVAVSEARKKGVPASVLLGIWKAESGFDVQALGDLNADNAAYSYGIGQLHVKGAGGGIHPRNLLILEVNASMSAGFLAQTFKAFPDSVDLAISAYNQGIQGAKDRGLKTNKAYVDVVKGYAAEFVPLDAEAAKAQPSRTYTVKTGDNLWKIAQRFYSQGNRWQEIYDANVKVIGPDPDLIFPGQVLTIP